MARDGSGTFNLAQAAFTSGTTIESAKVNSDLSDIAAGLTQSMSKDGQTVPTANIPLGGFRITGLGNATARTDAVAAGQIADGALLYAADTGSSTAYAIAPAPGISAYAIGQRFVFKAANANTTATPTLAVNGLAAGLITKIGGETLTAGEIPINGFVEVVVTAATPAFQILSKTLAATAETFLTSDATTAVAGTFVSGPSVTVGANLQTWMITASGVYQNSSGGNMTGTLRIHNGSADIADGAVGLSTGFYGPVSLSVLASLSGSTTFTLQATDNVGGSVGALKATVTNGATNKATSIRAVRLS